MTEHTNWTRPDLTAPPDDLASRAHARDGWQLVPKEPTDEMRRAPKESAQDDPLLDAAEVYRAMLAAAPSAQAPTGEGARQAPAWPDMGEHWYVTVGRLREDLLTITDTSYSGYEINDAEESLIVGAAQHLLAFVGYGLPPSDFDPDGSVPQAAAGAPDALAVLAELIAALDCAGSMHIEKLPEFIRIIKAMVPARKVLAEGASRAGQPTAQSQWGRLYTTANALVVRIGYKGDIDGRADEVESVMDALHDLDGGQWMPGLMPLALAGIPAAPVVLTDEQIGQWVAEAQSKVFSAIPQARYLVERALAGIPAAPPAPAADDVRAALVELVAQVSNTSVRWSIETEEALEAARRALSAQQEGGKP